MHTLQEPRLKFYPYLLMDVKYSSPEKKTREGVLLWGMADGEIVINTETWETTHGFRDCLDADACRNDFKVLQALATSKGYLSREELLTKLHVEPEVLEEWVDGAIDKHLIVQKGNNYYLHFEEPVLSILPQSKISQPLVTKPYNQALREPKKYSASQIEKSAKAAFGSDFTIRSTKEVFLPVYNIDVLNPDEIDIIDTVECFEWAADISLSFKKRGDGNDEFGDAFALYAEISNKVLGSKGVLLAKFDDIFFCFGSIDFV